MGTPVTDERAAFGVERAAITSGRLVSVAVGDQPGLKKRPIELGRLVADRGLEGDRHGGRGPRQLSLLDAAVLEAMRAEGIAVDPGELGENLLIARVVATGEIRPGDAVEPIVEGVSTGRL